MRKYAVTSNLADRRSEPRKEVDQYYTLEFSIDGLNVTYQFKVWNKATRSVGFLVQEDSDILPLLKVGDTLNVRYYSTDLADCTEYLETMIRHVTKIDQGRLKGHYLVGLEILVANTQVASC